MFRRLAKNALAKKIMIITYGLFHYIESGAGGVAAFLYLVVVLLLLIRVWKDCKILGESFGLHFLLIAMFPLIAGLCWLIVWPGAFRLYLSGNSLDESVQARIFRRAQKLRHQSSSRCSMDSEKMGE